MKPKKITSIILLFAALNHNAIAGQDSSLNLQKEREEIIHRYIHDLEIANYQGISALFEKEGTVISTSRGNVNAKDFFYSFLPQIASASTQLHQIFISTIENNRYTARFHFNFKLKDGETGEGEYVDEFLFSHNSTKLSSVYMFENLKFNIDAIKASSE